MKLQKLKLHKLSEASLKDKEMNALRGGNCCSCSCYYEYAGGSSTAVNANANLGIGSYGGYSPVGCNEYTVCDNGWWADYSYYNLSKNY